MISRCWLLSLFLLVPGSILFGQCPFAITINIQHTTTCTPCNGGINLTPTTGTPPYTYSWAVIGSTTSSVSGLCPGIYTVNVTDAANCTVTDTIVVQNNIMQINISESGVIQCNGDANGSLTALVTGSGPFQYSWSPSGGTAATETGLAAGCYTVTVTDANACTKTQSFCLFQPGPLNVFAVGNPDACGQCIGDAGAIGGGGTTPYNYLWSNAATGQTTTGLCSGNYTVTITDDHGCTNSQTVNIGNTPGPVCSVYVVTPASCSTCCDGELGGWSSGGTGPFTYSWNPGGQNTANATGLCTGNYSLTVTDANGCTCTNTINLPFTVDVEIVSVPEPVLIQWQEDEIEISSATKFSVQITDLLGRTLVGHHDQSGDLRLSLDVLGQGFYILHWETEENSQSVRFRKF